MNTTSSSNNAPPAGYRTGRKGQQTEKSDHRPIGSGVKRLIVGLAIRGLPPAGAAYFLIKTAFKKLQRLAESSPDKEM